MKASITTGKMANTKKNCFIANLGDDRSTDIAVVGGKGASLGKLVKAGFPVPPGFVVTTDAYVEFLRANGLEVKIRKMLKELNYRNIDSVEQETEKIRNAIVSCSLPEALANVILKAYQNLGDKPYVAVRSSGTAEDLAGASFAGQYETYLDIRGSDTLLDAVRRCWASMWTSRVTAYRHAKGFDHDAIGIAVVIQTMVEPDVAGVMFVGNPMNARADEIVINASYGLGEMVVSGSVTPDEYIVGRDSLKIKRCSLGSKELRVVRNLKTGNGTVKKPVKKTLQGNYTLSDDQASTLAKMGRQVIAYYGGLPQDIEWAMAGNAFFLLQSRPITGVEFLWEEDLDLWPSIPEDENIIWTRAWADEVWTGPITPLMWSIRGKWMHDGASANFRHFGIGDLADMRLYKYSRGTVYYDTRADELIAEYCLPSDFRAFFLRGLHPSQIEQTINKPFDLWRALKMFMRIEATQPRMGITNFFASKDSVTVKPQHREEGVLSDRQQIVKSGVFPSEKELRALGDDELKEQLLSINNIFAKGVAAGSWSLIFIYAPVIRSLLEGALRYWYTGNNRNAFIEILSGLPWRTEQFYDDYDFWKLGETIRKSKKLKALINQYEGRAFFAELKNHKEGRAFLSQYEKSLEFTFYRGHADRDMYFARRIEDPTIDYEALRMLANAKNVVSPEEREGKLNQRREVATAEVLENLSKQPMADLKVPVFKFLLDSSMKFFSGRDDSRPVSDIVTWQKKLRVRELGRRTIERGLLEGERDFYFLSLDELCNLLKGKKPLALAKAKVAGRKRAFNRFVTHEEDPPSFLKGNKPMDLDNPAGCITPNVLKGVGTSPGIVTARVRIVPTQKDIGRLEKGDILICHGTDPGWTAAFSIVSGVVAQTGGMLAHFSCLSREYGIPAISLPNAIKLIKDRAIITMNGSTGEVTLVSE